MIIIIIIIKFILNIVIIIFKIIIIIIIKIIWTTVRLPKNNIIKIDPQIEISPTTLGYYNQFKYFRGED